MIFSDAAAGKVRRLIQEEKNPDLKLRIYVTGGGCSGFQYGFSFDETVNDGDIVVDNAGVSLVIDPMSYQYLIGAEIDYMEGLEGAQPGFVTRMQQSCGCGSFLSEPPGIC
jgi:iron-sulfur cluster insertion protein